MLRNQYIDQIDRVGSYPRVKLPLHSSKMVPMNVGDIVPLFHERVLPNDFWNVDMSFLLRMFTPINQIFSNIYLDVYTFFCDSRLNWTHWADFCGQNDAVAFTVAFNYQIPVSAFSMTVNNGDDFYKDSGYLNSFACYLGLNPSSMTTSGGGAYDDYHFGNVVDYARRDYLNIYNEWFRDENVEAAIPYSKGDIMESFPVFTWASPLLKAAKFHDYFTDCVPTPMKAAAPEIDNLVPVGPSGAGVHNIGSASAVKFGHSGVGANGNLSTANNGSSDGWLQTDTASVGSHDVWLTETNLFAKLNITIEDIRKAAVVTNVLEKLTQSGSRYPEFLKGLWDTSSPSLVLRIPEYVSGHRFPIKISEVISNADTASGTGGAPLGYTGARSKTGDSSKLFKYVATEYGNLYVLGVIRVEQVYFQGNDMKYYERDFWDFPLPQLSGLGFQPAYKGELYAFGNDLSAGVTRSVFGYNHAYERWKRFPNKAVSVMRPDVTLGLQTWNASEIYASAPVLNTTFIQQPATGLDRCIAIPSSNRGAFQFYGEFLFHGDVTRVLPSSVPGIKRL